MKVALVSLGASAGEFSQFTPRLLNATVALYYVGEIFKRAGWQVEILDQPNLRISDQEILCRLQVFSPEVILFAQFFTTREKIRAMITKLRKEARNVLFGVAGHDATFHSLTKPEEYQDFSVVFQGPTLKVIVSSLEQLVKGSAAETVFINTLGMTEDPNLLPILEHANYQGTGFLVSSFGCFKKGKGCRFCTTPVFCPSGWRPRNIEAVSAEVRNLRETGRKEYFFLTDDDSLADLNRGQKLILACQQGGPNAMMLMTKPGAIVDAEKKRFIKRWINVKRIFLGLENGSPKGLIELGKNVKNTQLYLKNCVAAYEILEARGISVFAGYINFTGPNTDFSQLEESARFLYQMGASDWTALTQAWRPYPGTPRAEDFDGELWMEKGEAFYHFRNSCVERFHRFVFSLREETDRMDNLLYAITEEMYLQAPSVELWKRYRNLRSQWNELTYQFFIEVLRKIKNGEDAKEEDFLAGVKTLIEEALPLVDTLKNTE